MDPSNRHSEYTLFAWLDVWFKRYRAPVLRDGGYDLNNMIHKHVFPHIEDKHLDEYTALDITSALNCIGSTRMRQMVYQVYNQAFREAVRSGFVEKNPVALVDHPKHDYESGRSLSIEEEQQFLKAAEKDPLSKLFRFYILTGCRPSEALAIQWSDVQSTLLHIPGTKTTGSDRSIPISEPLRDLIAGLERKSEYLFPYNYRTVQKHLKALQARLNFSFTVKDLRHTFGTRCVESGVAMKTIQKWMGHSRFEITVNNKYGHTKNKLRIKAA